MPKIKISYGVALCRYNKKRNNQTEILLIKKRYSYHFFSFVFGYYKKYDDSYIKYLLNNMSFSEKIDIMGMQFNNMWYRIWLNNPENNFNIRDIYSQSNKKILENEISNGDIYHLFFKKKNKFEKNFKSDGGKKLRNMINESTDSEILWEIPKGGLKSSETPIDGAMREFYEETSINSKYYDILYDISPVIETHRDSGIIYKNIYYIARIKSQYLNKLNPRMHFNNFQQISEVEQIKWVSLSEIMFLNLNKKYDKKLTKLYKNIIKKFKKSNKFNSIH